FAMYEYIGAFAFTSILCCAFAVAGPNPTSGIAQTLINIHFVCCLTKNPPRYVRNVRTIIHHLSSPADGQFESDCLRPEDPISGQMGPYSGIRKLPTPPSWNRGARQQFALLRTSADGAPHLIRLARIPGA